MADLKITAAKIGVPMGDRTTVYDSRLAQELGLWAASMGKGHEFHNAAFQAYFVRGENIATLPVLLDMAANAGLDREAARATVESRSFKATVDRDWELSRAKNVQAAPTFFIGSERLVGAQSYERLAERVAKYAKHRK